MSARAVLLLPAEGDPLGLLRQGPCGFAPPTAHSTGCVGCGAAGPWKATGSGPTSCTCHLGLHRAGLEPVAAVEWDSDACATLTAAGYPTSPTDVREWGKTHLFCGTQNGAP